MIYTAMTNRAMRIAYNAHKGQVDKCGQPYIFHPYHIAEQMDDEVSTCVALLHDVVEDTDVTIEQLEQEFPPEVTDVLQLLTHEEGTDYFTYIEGLRSNSIARKVKLADIAHDSDETRYAGCDHISEEQLQYRRQKYAKARAMLEDALLLSLTRAKDGVTITIDILPSVIGRKSANDDPDMGSFSAMSWRTAAASAAHMPGSCSVPGRYTLRTSSPRMGRS